MEVSRNGNFSLTLSAEELSVGLRKIEANPRNSFAMSYLFGMVGKDKILQTIDQLTVLDTSGIISDSFPYPQLFILTEHILVCGEKKIYEYSDGLFTLKITASVAGDTWRVFDYINYICMSNGAVTIVRDPQTGEFEEDDSINTFNAACDFNGQAFMGCVGEFEIGGG